MKKLNKVLKKNEKAITLISLVVTIIVLLILAGISISMLSGDNGILRQATNARENSEKAQAIESARMDILGEFTENKGQDVSEGKVQEILSEYFNDVPEDLTDQIQEVTTKPSRYKVKLSEILDGVSIKFVTCTITYNANGGTGNMSNSVGKNAKVASNTFVAPNGKKFKEWNDNANGNGKKYDAGDTITEDITLYAIWKEIPIVLPSSYGSIVTNYRDGEDWEIFYQGIVEEGGESRIYLIKAQATSNEVLYYTAYNGTSDFTNTDNLNNKFPAVKYGLLYKVKPKGLALDDLKYSSNYKNMCATEYLLDSSLSKWKAYEDTVTKAHLDKFADFVIGGPTLELFVASWNASHVDNSQTIDDLTEYGYINNDYFNAKGKVPKDTVWNRGEDYWLACMSNDNYRFGRDVRYVNGESAGIFTSSYASYCRLPTYSLS